MPVITVGFNKILVQRLGKSAGGSIKINSNVSIVDIEKTELALGTLKQNALRFTFEHVTKYEPKYAEIELTGDLIYYTNAEAVDAILKEWKKDKKAPKEVTTEVINHLLVRCNIEALILSREMNLPSPIPLPKVQAK